MLWVYGVLVAIMVCPHQIYSYNTNRQVILLKPENCEYYDNPAFQIKPNFIQSRMGETQEVQPVIFINNRIRKESPYYTPYQQPPTGATKYQLKTPVPFFANMGPADSAEFRNVGESEEDEAFKIDYDKLWKVGEIPLPKGVKALPDVYVKPEGADAPPIVDMVSVEQSELTEETHGMENVEIEERYLNDPINEMEELIIERVTIRPEPPSTVNPALAMFKKIEIMEQKNEDEKKTAEEKPQFEPLKIDNNEEDKTAVAEKDKTAVPEKDKTAVPETDEDKSQQSGDSALLGVLETM